VAVVDREDKTEYMQCSKVADYGAKLTTIDIL